jgi:hypothetical protein
VNYVVLNRRKKAVVFWKSFRFRVLLIMLISNQIRNLFFRHS